MATTSAPRERQTTRVPLLIWIVAMVGVVAGSIVGLAELDDAWTVAAAVLAGLGALLTLSIVIRDELAATELPASTRVLGVRRLAAATGVVAAAALAAAVYAGSWDAGTASMAQPTAASAVDTVGDFVTAADVAGNGEAACSYLATTERASVGAIGGAGCRQALNDGIALPGGVDSDHALHSLPATVSVHGGRAIVRLGTGARAATVVLERVTPLELSQFGVPPSAWRIAAGVTALVQGAGPP
jgi:hypothetical protein